MAGPGAAFRRLGALSGAGALGLASYGAHGQGPGDGAGLCLGRRMGSGAGMESVGIARAPNHPTACEALSLLVPQPGPVGSQDCPCVFPPVRSLLGGPFSPLPPRVLPGVGALELVTSASPFHRRPVSGCLRKGGEVTALGLPDFRVYEGTEWGVPEGGAECGSLELQGQKA